ncbi:hypothetical protein PM082_012248 [Marasmius tenuissimus]|nr:hypothetical protein PM082_012248 [Marasmius tenuissimus]
MSRKPLTRKDSSRLVRSDCAKSMTHFKLVSITLSLVSGTLWSLAILREFDQSPRHIDAQFRWYGEQYQDVNSQDSVRPIERTEREVTAYIARADRGTAITFCGVLLP